MLNAVQEITQFCHLDFNVNCRLNFNRASRIMAAAQKDVKAVLLLSPYKLSQDQVVIDILVIDRSSSKSPFSNKELISNEIKLYFPQMEKPFRDSLLWFGSEGIAFTRDGIKKKYSQQRAGIPFSDYYASSMMRHMLELFQKIKPW